MTSSTTNLQAEQVPWIFQRFNSRPNHPPASASESVEKNQIQGQKPPLNRLNIGTVAQEQNLRKPADFLVI